MRVRWLLSFCFGLIALLVAGLAWYLPYPHRPGPGSGQVTVTIPPGADLRQIEKILTRTGALRQDPRFLILARLSGRASRLQAGEFLLRLPLTPSELIDHLATARAVQHKITIAEGLTLRQIADRLALDNWIDRGEFLALATDLQFIQSLGLHQKTLEGYLFPDTYYLVRGHSETRTILRTMVRRFLEVWKELAATTPSPELSRHQVVVLASIVEKETGDAAERPLIARVFLNRLRLGMRLQSDPTVIYGLDKSSEPLSRKDLRTPTPFNTYLIKGLPPSPICNPGRAALQAVLSPADSRALYFVSKNDGTHVFSRTLREHNRAVRKYQRK